MFTGIVSRVGKIENISHPNDWELSISIIKSSQIDNSFDFDKLIIGASIACSGICLTLKKIANNLLIEAGSKINTILLSLGLIDKLLIFRSGKIIGNDGLPMIDNLNIHSMNDLENYKLSHLRTFDDDVLEIRKLNN